jgi:hypothetical protein
VNCLSAVHTVYAQLAFLLAIGCATPSSPGTHVPCTGDDAIRAASARFADDEFRRVFEVGQVRVIDLPQYGAWIVIYPRKETGVRPADGRVRVEKATCKAAWQPGA